MEQPPVLVVGAGPTGLVAAFELSRMGVEVRIVDMAPQPSTTSRALGVQARTLELLRPRGVSDELVRLGNEARRTALHANGHRIAALDFTRMHSQFPYILLLAQSETERVLTEHLARQGVKVERGVQFSSLTEESDATQVVLTAADGTLETVEASYVIAADGSHSTVRKFLGLPFTGRALPQNYVLGDVHVDGGMAEDQLSIFLAAKGFLAVFPMGDGRFRLMATDPDGITGDAEQPSSTDVQTLLTRAVGGSVRLRGLDWSSRFRINSRHLETLRVGRVFFGGDSAHVHSPAGGQGMNAGIQDMINLSWKLAMVLRGAGRPELLDTYESDRLPVIRRLVGMTERATRVFNSTNPLAHAVLTRLAPLALAQSAVQDRAVPQLGQIAASYRGAPITKGGGAIGGLRAGDRVPDAAIDGVDGVRVPGGVALHDLIDITTPTLLVSGGCTGIVEAAQPWAGTLEVREVALPDDLVPGPGWLLVRPDGHLAAAGQAGDADRLRDWLDRWMVPRIVD